MARPPQARANRATIAEQQVKCYRLRLMGMSIRDIARTVGVSVGTVHNRIRAEVHAQVSPLADELMVMELARLDHWLLKLNQRIEAGVAVARSIEVAIRVSERRAKLLGLDAPVRTRVETITLDHIESEIERLERELAAHATEGGEGDN